MADVNIDKPTPWRNGCYQSRAYPSYVFEVEGENLLIFPASGKPTKLPPTAKGTWKYGDFGDAHPDVAKESGKSRYNVAMYAWGGMWKPYLVVSDDGQKLTLYGLTHSVDTFEWMSDEEYAEFLNSGDPCNAYPHQYKIQPENQGKLLWLSGAPGLGKSTSGMLLGRKAGYVYYEADAFGGHTNPYVSTDVDEPSLVMMSQKFLSGVPQERIDALSDAEPDVLAMFQCKEYDFDSVTNWYTFMCKDIAREQKRIGGDFAVAQAVPTRKIRDHIRTQLGPNLIFVVMHMSKEDQQERVKAKHGDEEAVVEMLAKSYERFEPAGDDEQNAIHLLVTKDMTRNDVVDKIIKLVNDYAK